MIPPVFWLSDWYFYATIQAMEWMIHGHEWAAQILQKHISQNNVRHAYLLSGAPGIGRRSLAIRFAQVLNCTQPPAPGEPCDECRLCKQIAKMQQADLTITQSVDDARTIKVEQIRELQGSLSLVPYEARYRIALMLNFHEATPNAQNALLKTLEEAPPKVILILTADSVENLLPTIVSRCEILRLRPLSVDLCTTALQKHWKVPGDMANELAHLTSGKIGQAVRYHQDPNQLEKLHQLVQDVFDLLGSSLVERFDYAEKIADLKRKNVSRESIAMLLRTWLSLWRDFYICVSGSDMPLTFLNFKPLSRKTAEKLTQPVVYQQLLRLETSLTQLDTNLNSRLLVETLLLDWPKIE
jgi:DNA polymerase-3 subunit delta'